MEVFRSQEKSQLLSRSDPSLATDLFNPRNVAIPTSLLQDPDWAARQTQAELWGGAYVQYQLSLADRLYLLSGWRFDYVSETSGLNVDVFKSFPAITGGSGSNSAHSGKQRQGILWRLAAPLSLYANYTENFGAVPGIYVSADLTREFIPPRQSAHEWEAGLKLEVPDGRLSATVAWFDLTKINIDLPLLEPALNQSGVLFLTGDAHNHGLEVDLRAAIASNLQFTASYAYIRSSIVNNANKPEFYQNKINGLELVGNTGNRLFGVPLHGGSAWGTYRFAGGWLGGLKVGAGAIVRGIRAGDNINDYQLPGFAKFNALAAYDWRTADTHMSVQLNVDNLLDKHYYESLSGTRTVMPGYPRRWIASYRVEF
jgi:iron complex outermembrane receptor protein